MKKADKHKCITAQNLQQRARQDSNLQPSDSKSVDHNTKPRVKMSRTNISETSGPELVSGLFFESENDPDLKLILQRWPELPDHIKAAIKALVGTHKPVIL